MFKIINSQRLSSLRYYSQSVAKPYTGRSYEEIKQERKQYFFPFSSHYYKQPFFAVRGEKQYLYDHTGKQYIDLLGGISCTNIGHSHPRLTKIYHDQMQKVLHSSQIYFNEYEGQYSREICEQLGPEFNSVFLCNSGSQANDMVNMIARLYTNSPKLYCLRQGYHGTAGNSDNFTNIQSWNGPIPKSVQIQKIPCPHFYHSPFKNVDQLILDAEQHIQSTSNGKIAGFIAEPVMGAGGVIPLPEGYLQRMFKLTRKYGGLCIADQVQTGFGRIGKSTWGFKWAKAKPDIVVLGKGIANGFPMAAVVARKQIFDSLKFVFFNTYGAGALQCRLASEVLKILKQQKLAQNAEDVGSYILKQFKKYEQTNPFVGEVRGQGMIFGIQFVKDKKTKEPNTQIVAEFLQKGRQKGILFGKGGNGNVLRCVGPLCLSMQNAKKVVGVFDQLMKAK